MHGHDHVPIASTIIFNGHVTGYDFREIAAVLAPVPVQGACDPEHLQTMVAYRRIDSIQRYRTANRRPICTRLVLAVLEERAGSRALLQPRVDPRPGGVLSALVNALASVATLRRDAAVVARDRRDRSAMHDARIRGRS